VEVIEMIEMKFRVFDRIHKCMHIVGTDQHDTFHIWDDNQVTYYNYQTGEPSLLQEEELPEDGSGYILTRYSGKHDISGQEVYEGDIIESHLGGQVLAGNMVIKYGIYQAYCPADKCNMDSVGFYAETQGYPDMPIGPLEDYAKVIGNIYENPKLIGS